jgi:hypothetical protein
VAAAVQKLRKSAGLVVADRVEVFYDCKNDADSTAISAAMKKHATSTFKRIKTLPLPASVRPRNAVVIAREVVDDSELAAGPVTVTLTVPTTAINRSAVQQLAQASTQQQVSNNHTAQLMSANAAVEMYLQTCVYESVCSGKEVSVSVDNVRLNLKKGEHYFPTTLEMVLSTGPTDAFPNAPSASDLQM